MRIRTIKPEFYIHADLYDAEVESGLPVRVAFSGLWCAADREGRFKWKPRELGSQILPHDGIDFSRVLDALGTRGFVVRYRVGDAWFGCIQSFSKHQVINNRERPSEIPDVSKAEEVWDAWGTREGRVGHASKAEGKGREGNMEGKGKERKGGVGDVADEPQPASKKKPLSDDEWIQSLSMDSAYTGLDVPREHAKMVRWCETNGKQPSRKRLVNWLNRAEIPMVGSGQRTPDQNGSKRILDTQPQIEIPEFK